MDVVDVTERLMAEFESRLDLAVITKVVGGCRRDLDASPVGALPELVERLARQRLLEMTQRMSIPQPSPPPAVVRLP